MSRFIRRYRQKIAGHSLVMWTNRVVPSTLSRTTRYSVTLPLHSPYTSSGCMCPAQQSQSMCRDYQNRLHIYCLAPIGEKLRGSPPTFLEEQYWNVLLHITPSNTKILWTNFDDKIYGDVFFDSFLWIICNVSEKKIIKIGAKKKICRRN